MGRVLGIDVGGRRVGLAISDRTGTLARPLETILVRGAADAVDRLAERIASIAAEEDGLETIVVGRPAHLDGRASEATAGVIAFITALQQRIGVPIVTEDERLTSREAERRLATNERNWRRRKAKLDAAAAAIFLQDYLDGNRA
jgi:putative holliday junction resolvase